jgi:hypothetical protein
MRSRSSSGTPGPVSVTVTSAVSASSPLRRSTVMEPPAGVYLDQPEADRTLARYRSRHPRACQQLKQVLEETLGTPITDTDTPLPMVELRLD